MSAPTTTQITREEWLLRVAEALWPEVEAVGGTKPARYRVSCGWPSRSALLRPSSKIRRIGECWSGGSMDKTREIFISPALANPIEVADVLLHEMIHAALPPEVGHRHPFPRIAKALGLEGKPTATFAGPELAEKLKALTDSIGPYPHAKLDADVRPKQKARQLLVECPDCGCKVRMARTWIETYLPTCGCGAAMVATDPQVAGGEEEPTERLKVTTSHVEYATEDGRFEASTTKLGGKAGRWIVRDVTTGEWTYRHNREDVLAFIAAVRAGETGFPEQEAVEEEWDDADAEALDDDLLGEVGDWSATEEDLWEDEEETIDYPEDQPEDEDAYEEARIGREKVA